MHIPTGEEESFGIGYCGGKKKSVTLSSLTPCPTPEKSYYVYGSKFWRAIFECIPCRERSLPQAPLSTAVLCGRDSCVSQKFLWVKILNGQRTTTHSLANIISVHSSIHSSI
ncbi:hypothetical protein I7I48_09948 [Histoplasma ohiense]|nr:hypothetical protein I7I48_09948 [Histoplasma ohiense (nom. inval.)]